MRFNDLVFAFPSLVIAILITAIAGPSAFNAIVAIGIFNIPVFARISRGLPYLYGNVNLFYLHRLQEKLFANFDRTRPAQFDAYIDSTSNYSIFTRYSCRGWTKLHRLGSTTSTPSWGRMLADAQTMVSLAPRLAIVPGVAIIITVLGLNLLEMDCVTRLIPSLEEA